MIEIKEHNGNHIDIAASLACACHQNDGLYEILKMAIDAYENVPFDK